MSTRDHKKPSTPLHPPALSEHTTTPQDELQPAAAVPAAGVAFDSRMLMRQNVLALQRSVGNQRVAHMIDREAYGVSSASRLSRYSTIQRQGGQAAVLQSHAKDNEVGFVREEGLSLRTQPNQQSKVLKTLKFGQRVHTLADPNAKPGWQKVIVLGQVGYVYAPRIHFPPPALIKKDPALTMIKVKSGQTFWELVKSIYGIQGNESTRDQNINHFINAIRAVNKPEAFKIKAGTLDRMGNALLAGRDASDTELVAGIDLWIPSFGVAAKMDVGSGTVRGEVARVAKKVDQKIQDFSTACKLSDPYIRKAMTEQVGNAAEGLLEGLVKFAREAVGILSVSTAAGALIGALFGGVGAIPGAEIGFEVGLLILELYGLASLVQAILGVAGNLLARLGRFIQLVWQANGDQRQLQAAGKTLADAMGILTSAILMALAAYVLKKGGQAYAKTRFAKTVGETKLMKWLKERQTLSSSRKALGTNKGGQPPTPSGKANKGRTSQMNNTTSGADKERQTLSSSRKTVATNFVNNILKNPTSVVGKTADDIARLFNDAGYKATVEQSSKKGTSGKAVQVRIEGHPKIANIQYHPGGGRHTLEGVPYWKISTNNGTIWVAPHSFKGADKLGGTIIYYD